ncbi:hypothetical protein SBOR_2728 [Sclerotinia borealis F-4128]|uniref:O-methyltransferase domain-containing protein n=1 Tax=Sclerotinia borealis (strain F-4128) TaxID=1432307 RepID=W9CLH5_SCLBF|nr:hypothetical protein SBOR_2728 [Sclerotinia borealis F-4128]
MSSPTKILSLAATISEATAIVNTYFTTHNLPTPSFEVSGPTRISIPPHEKEVSKVYAEVLRATMELHHLMLGPTAVLMGISPVDSLSLNCIYTYKIAHAFPVDSEATFEHISDQCGLDLIDTRRILRHAMTNHIFQEIRPGSVTHTAASKLLATNSLVEDFVGIASEERFQAAAHTTQALQKWGYARAPNQSGFSLGHQTTNGLYEELRSHPSRGQRWANAMSVYASKIPLSPLIDSYEWSSLGSATIAGVGGGYGPVSIGLASQFPLLNFVVQDFEDVVADGPAAEIGGTGKVVLGGGEEVKVSFILELTMDLNMLSYFGSRERSIEDWEGIFTEADERFEVARVVDLEGGMNCLMEVLWKGE